MQQKIHKYMKENSVIKQRYQLYNTDYLAKHIKAHTGTVMASLQSITVTECVQKVYGTLMSVLLTLSKMYRSRQTYNFI